MKSKALAFATLVIVTAFLLTQAIAPQTALAASSWTNTNGGVSGYTIKSLAYDSVHNLLYAGCQETTSPYPGKGVWKYDGTTWTDTGGGGISSLAYDSVHNILYAGTAWWGVWACATPNTTPTWTGGDLQSYYTRSLAYDSVHNLLYAGTSNFGGQGVVWEYDGTTWTDINGGLSGYSVRSLAYDSGHNLVYAGTDGGVWYYGVSVPVPPPTLNSISPNTGVAGGTVNVTNLAGTGFQAGATVRLELGATVVNATSVNVVSDTKITCQLVLPGTLGKYDVVVKNPGGQEGKLAGGFSVTNICGGGAAISLSLFGVMMGLMSLAGSGLYGRLRRKKK